MENFKLPDDLKYNNGFIKNPTAYLKDRGCISWLYLVGEEFSKMENGMSYEEVQDATPHSVNVFSEPTADIKSRPCHSTRQCLGFPSKTYSHFVPYWSEGFRRRLYVFRTETWSR